MPASLRALAFIYLAVLVVHLVAGKQFSRLIGKDIYPKLLKAYLFVLFAAALSPGYWIFLATVFLYIHFLVRNHPHLRISLFFLLLLAVPNFWLEIPGIAGIRFIMNMSYARFLILVLLLPLLLSRQHREYAPYRSLGSDLLVFGYVIINGLLGFREDTLTNAGREMLMLFIDIYIPYFVISRYVSDIQELRRILSVFVLSLCVLSVVSLIEIGKHWHIYNEFTQHLQTWNNKPLYLLRSGMLRASTVFYTPIALGMASVMAFGAYLYLKSHIHDRRMRVLIPLMLAAGLASSLSRGPWLGFVLLFLVHAYLHQSIIKKTFKYSIVVIVLIPILSITPYWHTFISLLPFIGNVEVENITYRQQLLESALLVLQKYPIFGSPNFLNEPEMQRLIQGQGIVDVVNSYVRIVLMTGLVGLTLFVSIFVFLLVSSYKAAKNINQSYPDNFEMGASLIAILAAALFIISTVSSIDYIPYLYWSFSGLVGAYILVNRQSHKMRTDTIQSK